MQWTNQTAPSLDDFARLAREAFDALPEPFRSLAGEVVKVWRVELAAGQGAPGEMPDALYFPWVNSFRPEGADD